MERQTITGSLSTSGRLSGALSVGGGTTDYNELENKPTYNGHVIEGELTNESLGIWQPFNFESGTEYALGFKYKNKDLYMQVVKSDLIPADTTLVTPTISGVDDYFILSIKSIQSNNQFEYSPCYISMYNYQGSGTNYGMLQYDKTNHALQFSNMSRVNQIYIEALVIYTKF